MYDTSSSDGGEPPLKAALADQRRLLEVQEADLRLDQLAHRRGTLPELAELDKLVAERARLRDLLVAARTEESDIAREQAKAESDVEQVRMRADRDRKRMDSGSAPAKEVQNLQHEIESLKRRQDDLEEIVLVVMERAEGITSRLAELAADEADVAGRIADVEAARDAATAEIDAQKAAIGAERAGLAEGLPDDLLALYEKIRAAQDGVGAAPIRRGRCEGCRLELDMSEIAEIRSAPDDEVVRHESCRRIIVRIPESGL